MTPQVTLAVAAAQKAGDYMMQVLNSGAALNIDRKDQNDFVTQVDRNAENLIVDYIRSRHRDHAFITEETGEIGKSDHVWIIDPLDGTTNYIHGFPQFAVSIAYAHQGVLEHAVVYNPHTEELFTASKGRGATLNKRRIRVSKNNKLGISLIGTGVPIHAGARLDRYMPLMKSVVENTTGIRRAGAAALDLAYVAAGRLDGFFELGLQQWDMAAGILLIQEAGGQVVEFDSNDDDPMATGNIIAGNPKICSELVELLR